MRGARLRDSIRGGREAVETWDPGVERFPKRHDHAPRGIPGALRGGSRAADQSAEHDLERVERARNADAAPPRDERCEPALLEMDIDHGRFRVEVEQVPQAREQRHQRRHQRERDLDVEMRARGARRAAAACRWRLVRREHHAADERTAPGIASRSRNFSSTLQANGSR